MRVIGKQQRNFANRMSWQSLNGIALAASVIAVGGVSAQTTQSVPSQRGKIQAEAAQSPNKNLATMTESGLVIMLDRETGETRPLTGAEAQKLADGLKKLVNQSTEGLVQVRQADGTVSMDLQGRFQNVLLARIEANGALVQGCVDSIEAASAFFDIDSSLFGNVKRSASRPAPVQLELR